MPRTFDPDRGWRWRSAIPAIDRSIEGHYPDAIERVAIAAALKDLSDDELEAEVAGLNIYPTTVDKDNARLVVRGLIRAEQNRRKR